MLMLAVDPVNPAVETPPARSIDSTEGSFIGSGGGGGGSGDDSTTGSSSPFAGRAAAALAPTTTRLAVVDRQESASSVFSSSRLSSWGSWGGVGGGGGSVAEGGSGAGKEVAEHGPLYHCQICLDDRPAEAGFLLSACGHTFCRACLRAYVTSKVADAEVYPTCFHLTEGSHTAEGGDEGRAGRGDDDDNDDDDDEDDDEDAAVAAENGRARVTRESSELGRGEPGGGEDGGGGGEGGDGRGRGRRGEKAGSCGVVLSPSDIKELLRADAGTSRKYARFLFSREHKAARECPKCGKLSVGDPSVSWKMRCGGCSAVFCYEHGGAHEGKSCAEYVESTADETHRTIALIGRLTKPCPGCLTPVEKLGGCNQMVCLHCNCSFCWICMEQVDRGTFPVHFQWWNVRGCPNQQLQEDSQRASPGGRQCLKALSVLQIIVVGPFALLLTVASSLACVCCLPAFKLPPRRLFTGCISAWGNFIMVLPLVPLVCASAVVAGVVYIIMLPFRLSTAVQRKCRFGRSGLSLPGPRSPGIGRARFSSSSDSSNSSDSSDSSGGASSSGGRVAASAGGRSSSLEDGTVGAADVDVETIRVPPSAAAVAAAAAALAEVLGSHQERGHEPQVPLGWRGERERREERRGRQGERTAKDGLRLQQYPHSSTPLPPSSHLNNGGGGGGDGGMLGRGAVAPPPQARSSSVSSVVPSAMPGRLGNSCRVSEGSGSGSGSGNGSGKGNGGGDGGGQLTTPISSLRVRQMLGRWLGAPPSPALVVLSSPSPAAAAAAVGAGVSAGVSGAAGARTPVTEANARSKAGAADEDEGEASRCPTTEGAAFGGSTAVFAPFSLPVDKEAPHPSAAATNGSRRDGSDDIL